MNHETLLAIFRQHNEDYQKQAGKLKVCTVIGNTAPCINTSRSSIEERYKVSAIALEELAPAFITDFELFLKTERTGF